MMDALVLKENGTHPYFSLEPWGKEFEHLTVGISARRKEDHWGAQNYALHVEGNTDQVMHNRESLAKSLGIPGETWVCGQQVHGNHVAFVSIADQGRGYASYASALPSTDGLTTQEENLLLVVHCADCVPIYFYDPDQEMIGMVHAGWRGTLDGIAVQMVKQWVLRGANRENIRVFLGPSIGPCCYEVDKPVIDRLNQVLPSGKGIATPCKKDNKWRMDVREANFQLLLQEGILPHHIQRSIRCTSCDTDHFYSYRKEGKETGRMMAWIGKKEKRL